MKTETETIKVIHILNEGFDWRIIVKDNPEFPEMSIVIEHQEEGEVRASISIPKGVIRSLQEALDHYRPEN